MPMTSWFDKRNLRRKDGAALCMTNGTMVVSLRAEHMCGVSKNGIVWSKVVPAGTTGKILYSAKHNGADPAILKRQFGNVGYVVRVEWDLPG